MLERDVNLSTNQPYAVLPSFVIITFLRVWASYDGFVMVWLGFIRPGIIVFFAVFPNCLFTVFQNIFFVSGNQTVLELCSVSGLGHCSESSFTPCQCCHIIQVIHCRTVALLIPLTLRSPCFDLQTSSHCETVRNCMLWWVLANLLPLFNKKDFSCCGN